ncbi:MAG TPA: hypothetical protein DGM69_04265 [Chloroflexi bacterium]|nr:hypothetical protein [Chloroflexota bacterium]
MIRRKLHKWEEKEAKLVFADFVDYSRITVFEEALWTNLFDDISRRCRLVSPRNENEHNAIALGFHCYFPVALPSIYVETQSCRVYMSWLIHEIAHVWQFQRMGWKYLYDVLISHLRYGADVYDYGGSHGLRRNRQVGKKLMDYNLEQQATILQDAYLNLISLDYDCIWKEVVSDLE